MKKRRLIYNFIHFNTLKVYTGFKPQVYTQYNEYFLGDIARSSNERIHFDLTTQSASTSNVTTRTRQLKARKALQKFTYATSLFYYKKLRFTGKGYKIKKTKVKKSLKLYFGRSHFQYIFSGGLRYKKLSKYRMLLISNNKKKLNRIVTLSLCARPLNKYTKRGFRSTRQFILKRPGKKSTH